MNKPTEKLLNILIVNQTYVPDPAAVGQHVADVAETLAGRGHLVQVVTSRRGYDDPSVIYPRRERRNGVDIHRVRLSSLGKQSIVVRMVASVFFTVQATLFGLKRRNLNAVVVTTAPPIGSFVGLCLKLLRRVPFVFWVLDVNPEQSVALGLQSERSMSVWLLRALNQRTLRSASERIVLDEFMERLVRRTYRLNSLRIRVIPPWAREQHGARPIVDGTTTYREELSILVDQIVVMYAGNHRSFGSMDTILATARMLNGDPRFVFVFAGGGLGKPEVERYVIEHGLRNTRILPYQPQERLGDLLGTADIHLVTMGDQLVGITHPCKVYGAMSVGRPVLYVGPQPSHISRLIEEWDIGWHVRHGEHVRLVELLQGISSGNRGDIAHKGRRAQEAESYIRQSAVVEDVAGVIEGAVG